MRAQHVRMSTTRPSAHQVRQIAVHIHRDPRAVRNAYDGRAKAIVIEQVRDAARELGLPLPPAPPAEDT